MSGTITNTERKKLHEQRQARLKQHQARARQQRIRQLTDEINLRVELDVAWFAAHPERRYRLRPRFPAELERHALIFRKQVAVNCDCRRMTIVPDLGSGFRNCMLIEDCHGLGGDPGDGTLRQIANSLFTSGRQT